MPTRRRCFLGGLAAILPIGLTGCTSEALPTTPETINRIYTAFYTLANFTTHLTDSTIPVENPIPPGELGHHYEVGTTAQIEIAKSLAFIYLDIPGFQPWARTTAQNINTEDTPVTLIDADAEIDLLTAPDAHTHTHDTDLTPDSPHPGETPPTATTDETEATSHDIDPHYWLDPQRAAQSVATIASGLTETQPDAADSYKANTTSYRDTLADLDTTFEAALADRDHDIVVIASHNSFQYLADRYDFQIHSPVGVTPDAEPSSQAITDTIDLIDSRGIDTILYDAFESPRLANTIVSESTAETAVALSSLAGTKPAWDEAGWGYIDQMKQLNLPALKAALHTR